MNSQLQFLYKQVQEKTGQYHLVDATVSAITHATYELHTQRFFANDCIVIDYDAEFDVCSDGATSDSIDTTGIPRYRRLMALSCVNAQGETFAATAVKGGVVAGRLTHMGGEVKAVYSEVGRTIRIQSREPVTGFSIVCAVFPDLTKDGFNSWAAELHWPLVVFTAAADILDEIGDKAAANGLRSKIPPLLAKFKDDSEILIQR